MTTLAAERSWLLDRGLLKLVHQCRRLILAEFGVKLHLTDNDLEDQLASYARQSRSSHLNNAWEELKKQVPDLAEQDDDKPRNYRGQELAEPAAAAKKEEPASSSKTRTITYRGRKMEVPA
ncbi:hypothetical protein [Marinobacter bohaiensis]|uniref:hypothetical protein n=1 Tax=Marinobacter bohaiensis TaxID=2201898 RepID=UPI000DAEA388|nr:hypothetical protein [Marinobacter bohaiensis]